MPILAPTPPDRMVDAAGRPYFLWDSELSVEAFRAKLVDPDVEVRRYYLGKLLRQAKPDDVFSFVDIATIRAHWDGIRPYLGTRLAMWTFLLDAWARADEGPSGA